MERLEKARKNLHEGKYSDALLIVNKVLKKIPNSLEVLRLKLRILEEKNDLENAKPIYKKLFSLLNSLSSPNNSILIEKIQILEELANIYSLEKNFSEAISYSKEALRTTKNVNRDGSIPQNILEEKSNILEFLADISHQTGDFLKALSYNQKLLKLYKKSQNNQGLAETMDSIADIYFIQKQYQKAEKFYENALKQYQKIKEDRLIGMIHFKLGKVYLRENKSKIACSHFHKAAPILNLYKEYIPEYYQELQELISLCN